MLSSLGHSVLIFAADDVQLMVLNQVFERTAYPSTEERDALARQLGMTSRSVQIRVRFVTFAAQLLC